MNKSIPLTVCLLALSTVLFGQSTNLTTFSSGYNWLTGFEKAPGDNRLYVFQKNGVITICNPDGSKEAAPFLDLNVSGHVMNDGERGLVGLAFHPNYQSNGYFYTFYSRAGDGASTISRWKRSDSNPNTTDLTSEGILLSFAHPGQNHVGGCMKFGPDGYLYIATGDGGGAGDPNGNGQNLLSFAGKILRIDVGSSGGPYTVPAENPFVGVPNTAPEIWAYGLRNPWRISFDRWTGDLWIADVGQDEREEVNFQQVGSAGGHNYGWSCKEGTLDYNANQCFTGSVYTYPIFEYGHLDVPISGWCYGSITGGVVYRGNQYADLFGKYIFTDFCSNKIWALSREGGNVDVQEIGDFSDFDFSVLDENSAGELFLTGHNTNTIFQLKSNNCAPVAWIPVPDTIMLVGASIQLPLYQGSGFSYQWRLNGNPIPNATGTSLNVTGPGTYSVVVTNLQNGCTNTSNAVVVTSPGSINIAGPSTTCANSVSVYSVGTTPGATYQWMATNGTIVSGQGSNNVAVLWNSAGQAALSLSVTPAGGTPMMGQLSVQVQANTLSLTADFSENVCPGESDGFIDLSVSGLGSGFVYNWSNGATSQDLANLMAGTYSVTVTSLQGCQTTASYNVNEAPQPVYDLQVLPETCTEMGSFFGTANSPQCGTWTLEVLPELPAGPYTVTTTDCIGCFHLIEFEVLNQVITIDIAGSFMEPTPGNSDGFIQVIPVNGTPPYSYLWENGTMEDKLANIPAGIYTATVTDANGCTGIFSLNLGGVNAAPQVQNQYGLTVFPNPTGGEFKLLVHLPQAETMQVGMFDATGKMKAVLLSSQTLQAGEQQLELSLGGNPPGVYFLKVDIGGSIFYRKIIAKG